MVKSETADASISDGGWSDASIVEDEKDIKTEEWPSPRSPPHSPLGPLVWPHHIEECNDAPLVECEAWESIGADSMKHWINTIKETFAEHLWALGDPIRSLGLASACSGLFSAGMACKAPTPYRGRVLLGSTIRTISDYCCSRHRA
jgi:hypothetical protein